MYLTYLYNYVMWYIWLMTFYREWTGYLIFRCRMQSSHQKTLMKWTNPGRLTALLQLENPAVKCCKRLDVQCVVYLFIFYEKQYIIIDCWLRAVGLPKRNFLRSTFRVCWFHQPLGLAALGPQPFDGSARNCPSHDTLLLFKNGISMSWVGFSISKIST